jgi:hypothetical protein
LDCKNEIFLEIKSVKIEKEHPFIDLYFSDLAQADACTSRQEIFA